MALQKQKNRLPRPAEGTIPARLARIIEIGEHLSGPKGVYGLKPMVQLYFSLPTRIIDAPDSDYHGKQAMVKSRNLNMSSSNKSSLVKDYIKVIKPSFDLSLDSMPLGPLVNLPLYVQIEWNDGDDGEEYTNIINTMSSSL